MLCAAAVARCRSRHSSCLPSLRERAVGDRPYDDVHGAKSAGMRFVLIPNSDVPAYAAAEPDAVISRLAELRPLLESSCTMAAVRQLNLQVGPS